MIPSIHEKLAPPYTHLAQLASSLNSNRKIFKKKRRKKKLLPQRNLCAGMPGQVVWQYRSGEDHEGLPGQWWGWRYQIPEPQGGLEDWKWDPYRCVEDAWPLAKQGGLQLLATWWQTLLEELIVVVVITSIVVEVGEFVSVFIEGNRQPSLFAWHNFNLSLLHPDLIPYLFLYFKSNFLKN